MEHCAWWSISKCALDKQTILMTKFIGKCVLVYVVDILILRKNEEHVQPLKQVLQALRMNQNYTKIVLHCLGYIVGKEVIKDGL